MGFWSTFGANIAKDEQWVVAEIAKAWADIQAIGQTVQMDVGNVQKWIASHHLDITNLLKGALAGFQTAGTFLPVLAPEVAAATLAVDAATAAVDSLSQSVLTGVTPISTIVNTYHAVKDAQTAVTAVLKVGTAQPAAVPATSANAPVIVP